MDPFSRRFNWLRLLSMSAGDSLFNWEILSSPRTDSHPDTLAVQHQSWSSFSLQQCKSMLTYLPLTSSSNETEGIPLRDSIRILSGGSIFGILWRKIQRLFGEMESKNGEDSGAGRSMDESSVWIWHGFRRLRVFKRGDLLVFIAQDLVPLSAHVLLESIPSVSKWK